MVTVISFTDPDRWSINFIVGWQTPKRGVFSSEFVFWYLKVGKSNAVLTDYCQIYGLPLTFHVISGQNREVPILAKIIWDVIGSP